MKTRKQASTDKPRLLDRLSIRQRLVGAVVCILLLFGLSIGVSFVAFENVEDAREVSEQVSAGLVQAGQIEEAVSRSESALRAYALTGAPRFVSTIEAMNLRSEEAIAALSTNLNDSSVQGRRLAQVDDSHRQWRKSVLAPVMAQVRAGDLARSDRAQSAEQRDQVHRARRGTRGNRRAGSRYPIHDRGSERGQRAGDFGDR